jgi:hypothetical protein
LRSQNSLNCNDDKGNTDLTYQNISHGEIQNPAESFVGNIRQGEHLLVERDINDSVVDGKALFIVISKLKTNISIKHSVSLLEPLFVLLL